MKDIRQQLVALLHSGYCVPQISRLAKKLKQPSTTIHYNIHKLQDEGVLKDCKAVFDYKKINQGFCVYILINLLPDKYDNPEAAAKQIASEPRIESVDICTGDYELIAKMRCKDTDEYYEFMKYAIRKYGIAKVISMTSLKQMKSEFVEM